LISWSKSILLSSSICYIGAKQYQNKLKMLSEAIRRSWKRKSDSYRSFRVIFEIPLGMKIFRGQTIPFFEDLVNPVSTRNFQSQCSKFLSTLRLDRAW
jgi:hypothetical protein